MFFKVAKPNLGMQNVRNVLSKIPQILQNHLLLIIFRVSNKSYCFWPRLRLLRLNLFDNYDMNFMSDGMK